MKKFAIVGIVAGVLSAFGAGEPEAPVAVVGEPAAAVSEARPQEGRAEAVGGREACSDSVKASKPDAGKRARRKLTDEEKEACRERLAAARLAREKAAADKAGLTLEAYRERRDAAQAKRLGMSVEEFRKLTPAERRSKSRKAKVAQA